MATTPYRIDVHYHIVPPEYVEAVTKLGITGAGGLDFPVFEPTQALEMMDRQGIATAIVSLSTPGVYFGDIDFARELARRCNEYAARLVADYPQRFGGFATLPLPDVDAALHELAYALDTLHLDGIVLLSNYAGRYPGGADFDALFAELQRRRAVVFIHPTVPQVGTTRQRGNNVAPIIALPDAMLEFVFDTTRAVASLLTQGTFARYPDVRYILSHAGGTVPYLAWRLALGELVAEMQRQNPAQLLPQFQAGLSALQSLYYDTTLSATPVVFPSLLALVPPQHILFGSDYPWATEAITTVMLQGIAAYPGFDDAACQVIERDAALALFPRLSDRVSTNQR